MHVCFDSRENSFCFSFWVESCLTPKKRANGPFKRSLQEPLARLRVWCMLFDRFRPAIRTIQSNSADARPNISHQTIS